jgi:hypothetical protein
MSQLAMSRQAEHLVSGKIVAHYFSVANTPSAWPSGFTFSNVLAPPRTSPRSAAIHSTNQWKCRLTAASYPAIALGADTMFVAWPTHTEMIPRST